MLSKFFLVITLLFIQANIIAKGDKQLLKIEILEKQGCYLKAYKILETISPKDGKVMFRIADYLFNGRKGIAINKTRGREYYKKAFDKLIIKAEKNNPEAQYLVGICYRNGYSNFKKATVYFIKSAKNGFPDAQATIALCIFKGEGTKRNPKMALIWLRKAVNNGSMLAKAYLASYYLGSRMNIKKGIKLAQEASRFENAAGQYTLAMAYEKGVGVKKDANKALELYQKSADQGCKDAKLRLSWLQQKLDIRQQL